MPAAFVRSVNYTSTFYDPTAGSYTNDDTGVGYQLSLKADQLLDAAFEYYRAEGAAVDLLALGVPLIHAEDPARECPACAYTDATELADGEPPAGHVSSMRWCPTVCPDGCCGVAGTLLPAHALAMGFDAVNKACRYVSAGKAQAGIAPTTRSFLGAADAEVAQDFATGALRSAAMDRAKAADAVLAEQEAASLSGFQACTTALHCNRATASSRAELDMHGMVGATCAHGFPGRGLMLGMRTPEQHYYYDVLIKWLLRKRPDLAAIYLDLACRYKPRHQLLVESLIEQGLVTPQARDVRLMLPWMHGFDHGTACQLQNSGLYQVRHMRPN